MTSLTRVTLEADSRQIRRAANDVRDLGNRGRTAGQQVDRFGRQTNRATQQTRQLSNAARTLTRVLGAVGIGLSVRALQQFVVSTTSAANELGKLSNATGISTDRLQELRFAFGQLADVTDRQVNESLIRFSRRIDLARRGTGAAQNALRDLGINLNQNTNAALDETINKLIEMGETQSIVGIASELFGDRTGPLLAAALQQGTSAMEAQVEQAHALGLVIREELIRDGEEMADQFRILSMQLRTQFQSAVLDNKNAIIGLTNAMQSLLQIVQENIRLFQALGLAVSAVTAIKLAQWAIAAATGIRGLAGAIALLSGPGAAIFVLAGVLGTIANEMDRTRRATDEFAQSLENLTLAKLENELQRLQERRRELISERDQLDIFSQPSPEAANELRIIGQQTKEIQKAIEQYKSSTDDATESTKNLGDQVRITAEEAQDLGEAFAASLPAIDKLPPSVRDLNNAVSMTGSVTRKATDDLDELGDVGSESADIVFQEFDRAAMQIEGAFANAFEQIFSKGTLDFASFAQNLVSIFQRSIAEMAAQDIVGGITGGGGIDFTGLIGGAQGTTSISGGAPPNVRGIGPAQGTGTAPSATSMAIAGVGGGIGGGMIGGETGSQLGSVGATIGMSMGGPAGAFLGGLAGGIAGRVFGKSESTTERLIKAERELIESRADAAAQILINENRMDDATRKRERELRHVIQLEESLSESNRERLEEVFALEEMAMRLQEINRINDEREQLERRFLQTIGDTTALRQMELDATEAANRGILRFIFTLEDAAAKVAQAEANARQAFNLLQESIRREQAIIEQQFQAPIRAIGAALDRLESRARAPLTRTARDQAMSVLQMARSQGIGAISQEELDGALQVVSEPSERLFSSFEDYQRDFTRTRVVLEDILDETESTAEKQLAQLTSQLEQGERMINALFGIDDRVLSVADAMQNLQAAVSSVTSARADLQTISSSPPSFTPRPTPPSTLTPGATDDPLWESILGNQFQAHIDRFGVSWHTSRTSEAERQAALAQMQQAYMRAKGFADGGVHTGGMRIVGERGPELEATGPSRIMSHEDMMKGLRGDNMVAELRSLKEEVAALRSEQSNSQYQIAKNTKRTRDTLEKFDIDGLPPERT